MAMTAQARVLARGQVRVQNATYRGTNRIAMFSIRALTPESTRRRPYISNVMQMVYKSPRIKPPRRVGLLSSFIFL